MEILNRGLHHFKLGKLETRLARLLLNYRRTPLANGLSSAKIMLGRKILTRLDTFRPHPYLNGECPVGKPSSLSLSVSHPHWQGVRNAHRSHAKTASGRMPSQDVRARYTMSPPRSQDDSVLSRNYTRGSRWDPNHIVRPIGSQMFLIDTPAGHVRRHKNQLHFIPPEPIQPYRDNVPELLVHRHEIMPAFVFPHTPTPTAPAQPSIIVPNPSPMAMSPLAPTPQRPTTQPSIDVTPPTPPISVAIPPTVIQRFDLLTSGLRPAQRSTPYNRLPLRSQPSPLQQLTSHVLPTSDSTQITCRRSTRLKKPPARLSS